MNVGKIKKVESVKGYTLNAKELGCKYYPICFTCPYKDCIKGKKFETTPQAIPTREERQAAFEACLKESCAKYTGGGNGNK